MEKEELKKNLIVIERGSSSVTVSADAVIIRSDKITISSSEQA